MDLSGCTDATRSNFRQPGSLAVFCVVQLHRAALSLCGVPAGSIENGGLW